MVVFIKSQKYSLNSENTKIQEKRNILLYSRNKTNEADQNIWYGAITNISHFNGVTLKQGPKLQKHL